MAWMQMTCGGCGHQADIDEFCRTPISGELPKGRYQCPACGLAIWKVLSPLTGKVALVEVPGVL